MKTQAEKAWCDALLRLHQATVEDIEVLSAHERACFAAVMREREDNAYLDALVRRLRRTDDSLPLLVASRRPREG